MTRSSFRRLRAPLLAASLVAALLAGCQPATTPVTGSARVTATVTSAQVARVQAALTGTAPLPQIVYDLVRDPTGDGWSLEVPSLPPGELTVRVWASDAAGAVLFEGTGRTLVVAGQTAALQLYLQEVSPPPSYGNAPPHIDAIGASALSVAPGEQITVSVNASDPDPGAQLSFLWRATGGLIASPVAPITTWTAPAAAGEYTLFVTVRDEKNAAAEASFTLRVEVAPPTTGALQLRVALNLSPVVTDIALGATRVLPGEPTSLVATVVDSDGDAFAVHWTSSCGGTFSAADAPATTFTPPAGSTTGTDACRLELHVDDGRGGAALGWTVLWVGPPPALGTIPPPPPPPPPPPAGFVNGGFETRDYAGWTLLEPAQAPTDGTFAIALAGQTILPGSAVFDFAHRLPVEQDGLVRPVAVDSADGSPAQAVHLQNVPQSSFRMFQRIAVPATAQAITFLAAWDSGTFGWAPGHHSVAVNLRAPTTDAILATEWVTVAGAPAFAPWHPIVVPLRDAAGSPIAVNGEVVVDVELRTMAPVVLRLDAFEVR